MTSPKPMFITDGRVDEGCGEPARIEVLLTAPDTLTFMVESNDPWYSFRDPQSMPVTEFLTKLGLHREAAAAEMLAFVRNYVDNSECDALGCLSAGNSRVLCGHCQAAALVERARNGDDRS